MIFQFQPQDNKGHYGIIRVDAQGNTLKYLGSMSDSGLLGDQHRGDGVFSRKLEFKQKKVTTLYFHIIKENTGAKRRALSFTTHLYSGSAPPFLFGSRKKRA